MKSGRDVICRARDLGAVKAYYAGELAVTLYYELGEAGLPVFEFFVDDVGAAKSRLTTAGCEIVEEDASLPRVYLRDRFGLVFNITEA